MSLYQGNKDITKKYIKFKYTLEEDMLMKLILNLNLEVFYVLFFI